MHRVNMKQGPEITFSFEGKHMTARSGDSVAAALLASNHWTMRTTPVSGAARGPFCMMGVCFDCLVMIDGVANCQACMTEVRQGMSVKRQQGAGEITTDILTSSSKAKTR